MTDLDQGLYSPISYTADGFLCMITYSHLRHQKLKKRAHNINVSMLTQHIHFAKSRHFIKQHLNNPLIAMH